MAEEAGDVDDEMQPTASFDIFNVEEQDSSKDVHMKNALVRKQLVIYIVDDGILAGKLAWARSFTFL